MNIIERRSCVLNSTEDLELLEIVKNFPISMNCVDSINSDHDEFIDMEFGISKSSGLVQLLKMIPPESIYNKNYHGSGKVGSVWNKHHKSFYEFISKDSSFSNILEVGGGIDGILSSHFLMKNEVNYDILEPSAKSDDICTERMFNGYLRVVPEFLENYNTDIVYDAIIHSHVFEHSYEPLKFLNKINSLLSESGSHYISIPNMRKWLNDMATNALHFEHTFYVDENVMEIFLNKSGFVIDKIEVSDHSIFIKAKKFDNIPIKDIDLSYIKNVFVDYINTLNDDILSLIRKINGRKVYLFGAHIFSQYLLCKGIDESDVICILDNDSRKQKKRLYGTNLIVESPDVIVDVESPIIILRAGVYNEEIKSSLLRYNDSCIFY